MPNQKRFLHNLNYQTLLHFHPLKAISFTNYQLDELLLANYLGSYHISVYFKEFLILIFRNQSQAYSILLEQMPTRLPLISTYQQQPNLHQHLNSLIFKSLSDWLPQFPDYSFFTLLVMDNFIFPQELIFPQVEVNCIPLNHEFLCPTLEQLISKPYICSFVYDT